LGARGLEKDRKQDGPTRLVSWQGKRKYHNGRAKIDRWLVKRGWREQ